MSTRRELRHALAKEVCRLSYARLLEYGITRVGDVTGLDVIDLPVFTSCRPSGKSITISAGKGLDKIDSKAGAIFEAIELWCAENPNPNDNWAYCSHKMATQSFANVLDLESFQLARDSLLNENTPIAFDETENAFTEEKIIVPSDMIWMVGRVKPPFQYFQSSSNGLASGMTTEDALLQGLYEVVERDGWSLSEYLQERSGQWPARIDLENGLPDALQEVISHVRKAGVFPFLFDLTTDLGIPIFRCTLIDDSHRSPGSFSGFGCSLDASVASCRAILEAVQARSCYISGARDDLFRRKFVLLKRINTTNLLKMYQSLPTRPYIFKESCFNSVHAEWEELQRILTVAGIDNVLFKVLYQCREPKFTIVKVVCPDLETPNFEFYVHGKRAQKALERCVQSVT